MQLQADKSKQWSHRVLPRQKVQKIVSPIQNRFLKLLHKVKPPEPTVEDIMIQVLRREIEDARLELHQAESNFEYAEKDYIDIAVNEWEVAKKRYDRLVKELNKMIKDQALVK